MLYPEESLIDEKVLRKQKRRTTGLSLLCLFFIIVPNFNIIDFLPDFVSYLILAGIFGKYAEQVPYFAEARDAYRKLAIVTAVKIPAMLVMVANMASGRDIVALFSLVFVSVEILLLFGAVKSSFSALYYLGERGSSVATVAPFRTLGFEMRPETLETLTFVYLCIRGVLNVIPDFFLLTADITEVQYQLRMMFPIATLICMSLSFVLGLIWLCFTLSYARSIAGEGKVESSAREIAGEDRMLEIERGRSTRSVLLTLTFLFVSSLLCFDISIEDVNSGVSVLPAFIWAFAIILCALRLFDRERDRMLVLILGIVYSAISVWSDFVEVEWEAEFDHADLSFLTTAKDAYIQIEILSVFELLLTVAISVFLMRGLFRFIDSRVVKRLPDSELSKMQSKLSKSLRWQTIVFAFAPALLALLRCIGVFLKTQVVFIPVDSTAADVTTVATTPAPWLGTVVLALTVVYVFFSYFYIAEIKGEIKLKEE